ncbi:MAG: UvrB/UvrC motif-containing protein [Elusimicrobia bacterium]|nr:UvrB/UvrC motif-containing protein [Elusimicrobiota bacterium]
MTICDSCGDKPANVFFKALVNNKSTKFNLCQDCAQEKGFFEQEGIFPGFGKSGFALADMIGNMAAMSQEELAKSIRGTSKPAQSKCAHCGTTFAQFKSSGFVGCNDCYDAFYPAMKGIIKKIHGAALHDGQRYGVKASPKTASVTRSDLPRESLKNELTRLRSHLNLALQKEAYEQAALLRDQIREIQKKTGA